MVCTVYPLKTDQTFINTLEDMIQKQRAMAKLINNSM